MSWVKVVHSNCNSMDKIKVLLVEDEATLAMIVQETLGSEGFEVTVANDGFEGIEKLSESMPDILVVDIMMPKMDGFEMVRRIRETNKTIPVLFLTARSSVNDVVEGFEIGGNDYLRKPFSMLELIVRIKALVQRYKPADLQQAKTEIETIRIGRYSLNPVTQMLSFEGESEELSHRESELLLMLASNINDVVTTKDILLELWGDDSPYNAKSLQVFITKLRHKLSDDENIKIINVRGIGYKMIE